MHRNINHDAVPAGCTVARFSFPDVMAKTRTWWLVITPGHPDVCDADPGRPGTATVTTSPRTMCQVWRGDLSWPEPLRSGRYRGPARSIYLLVAPVPALASGVPASASGAARPAALWRRRLGAARSPFRLDCPAGPLQPAYAQAGGRRTRWEGRQPCAVSGVLRLSPVWLSRPR